MATIRWCPIFPKWDIYQPLWIWIPFWIMCEREKHTIYSGGTLSLSLSLFQASWLRWLHLSAQFRTIHQQLRLHFHLASFGTATHHYGRATPIVHHLAYWAYCHVAKNVPHTQRPWYNLPICKPSNCSHQKKKHTFKIIQRLWWIILPYKLGNVVKTC